MKLVESILTKNPCYTAGRKITVKGLMLHSVGCPQPSAQVFVRNWNKASYDRACVHAFIDGNDGTVYQCLPWNHRGWHCGASGNNTHIGVEMCEPACIKYTGGATFTCSDKATAQAVAKRTYEAAVELFAMLCQKFSLDPLGDGVIVSHKEGCKRGIASNHGDPEHLWTQLGLPYTMDTFRKAVKAAMDGGAAAPSDVSGTKIMGAAVATAEQMRTYIKAKNPKVAQSVLDMVPLYLSEGAAEGVRGDIAFAQSCLETGNFSFAGSAVTLGQNNFCGMGVTASGMKGNTPKKQPFSTTGIELCEKSGKITQQHISKKFIPVYLCNDMPSALVVSDVRGIARQNVTNDLIVGAIPPLHQGRVHAAHNLFSLCLVHCLFASCQNALSQAASSSISRMSSMGMTVPSMRTTIPCNGSIFLIVPRLVA